MKHHGRKQGRRSKRYDSDGRRNNSSQQQQTFTILKPSADDPGRLLTRDASTVDKKPEIAGARSPLPNAGALGISSTAATGQLSASNKTIQVSAGNCIVEDVITTCFVATTIPESTANFFSTDHDGRISAVSAG